MIETRSSVILGGLLLLASALPAFPQGFDLRCAQVSTSRFVGTIRRTASFEDFAGTAIPLDFVVRRVVRVHVDRWLDEPALAVEDETVALFVDDLHTYFARRPYTGKTYLFSRAAWRCSGLRGDIPGSALDLEPKCRSFWICGAVPGLAQIPGRRGTVPGFTVDPSPARRCRWMHVPRFRDRWHRPWMRHIQRSCGDVAGFCAEGPAAPDHQRPLAARREPLQQGQEPAAPAWGGRGVGDAPVLRSGSGSATL